MSESPTPTPITAVYVLLAECLSREEAATLFYALSARRGYARMNGSQFPRSLTELQAIIASKASPTVSDGQAQASDANAAAPLDDWVVEPIALTYDDAAKRLSVSLSTLGRWVRAEKIRAVAVGGVKRIPASELDRLMAGPEAESA